MVATVGTFIVEVSERLRTGQVLGVSCGQHGQLSARTIFLSCGYVPTFVAF